MRKAEYQLNIKQRKGSPMKKAIIATAIAFTAVCLTGCSTIYGWFNTTPEQAHQYAVEKVTDYVENYVVKKIEKSDNLTDQAKEKLIIETAVIKKEILNRIAKLKEKYDQAKAEKQAAKEGAVEAADAKTATKTEETVKAAVK